MSRDEKLMAVTVRTESGSGIALGRPDVLIEGDYFFGGVHRVFDLAPDGERFLMIKERDDTRASSVELILVENWLDELARLVPTHP